MVGLGEAVLLEREGEKDALRAAFERARAGEGTLILLEGPAGVGKTELSREARLAAERARLTPIEGKGSELERPFAFGVVRQLLEPAVHRSGDGLLTGAAAPAARLFEVDERPSVEGDAGFEALHSLYWLVVNLVDQGPLLLLVDDCQWVDRDSLRFLSYLAQRIEDLPVVLLARRPPTRRGGRWRGDLLGAGGGAPHDGRAQSAAAERGGGQRADARAPRRRGRGRVLPRVSHGDRRQPAVRARAAHRPPHGGRRTLGQRRGRGPGRGAGRREPLRAAPARHARPGGERAGADGRRLGDESELRLAARVSGLGAEAARTAADDLVRADILARGARLGFVHPIVRAALYEDLGPGEREARHAAAAEALVGEGATPERADRPSPPHRADG